MSILTAADPLTDFLAPNAVVDWTHPSILTLARRLAGENPGSPLLVAAACFHWVRDEIRHSADWRQGPVTCQASEVLAHGTGFCYAKNHLLAALLRANGIPAGLCYQRLVLDRTAGSFCLHGLNGVHLPGFGWYRCDARGLADGTLPTQFDPPTEYPAYRPAWPGERDLPGLYPSPLPQVAEALSRYERWDELMADLPDWSGG